MRLLIPLQKLDSIYFEYYYSSSNFEIEIRNSLIIVLNFEPLFSLVENVDNDSMIIISNALLFLHFRFGKRKRKLWHIISYK